MSDQDPIIPTVGQVIGRAKERLVELRPNAERHVEDGVYGLVIEGWRGQMAPVRARLADEVLASRLPTSQGQALTELARSEFDTPRNAEPSKAIGEVELRRTVVHYVRGAPITAPDATDESGVITLLEAIAAAVNRHIGADADYVDAEGESLAVYRETTGRGHHAMADGGVALAVLSGNMGQLCGTSADFKSRLNRHFANQEIASGVSKRVHPDPDPLNAITTPDATPSNAGAAFGANSAAAQIALLLLVNATKAAFNRHVALEARPGTIRRGTVFRVAANPNVEPQVAGGEYVCTADAYCPTGTQTATVPVEAAVEGPSSNLPLWSVGGPALTITAASPLFDAGATLSFGINALRAAGGSSGQSDVELRKAAAAAWQGSYGPTAGALEAGTLRSPGVSRVAILENTRRGGSVVYPTDPSWSWSARWSERVERELRDEWLGVGCRLSSGRVVNRVVRVEATVALRSADLLVSPEEVTFGLRRACLVFFDLRPDFWIWRLDRLRAGLSIAHRGILSCSDVRVKDADGFTITEPAQPEAGDDITHWHFQDIDVGYLGPS